jgi:glycerol-3-phosphate dehydrogenase subunit B
MRLQRALTEALGAAGGRLVLGPDAVGVEGGSGRVTGVRVRQAARVRSLPADAVVLATGGFASGGIELDSRGGLRETVADLPVLVEAGEARLSPRHLDPQPLMRSGLRVDDRMRPVGEDGAPVWTNLHAAGALLAGAEPWREKSGEGICLAGAVAAASAILEER